MKKTLQLNAGVITQVLLACLLISSAVSADVPPAQVSEVEHLLDFVTNSGCTIDRNGTAHPAEEAQDHIKKKYDYFVDDIKNTEDFIRLSATKSTMSGNYYTVTCPGEKTIRTQDWLLKELERFRSGRR